MSKLACGRLTRRQAAETVAESALAWARAPRFRHDLLGIHRSDHLPAHLP